MQIGDMAYGGIYVDKINGHHIICSPIEYDLPVEVNWYQAAEYCRAIRMDLPTIEELNLLYNLFNLAPEYFPNRYFHWYWSSSERTSTIAWGQYFDGGGQFMSSKASGGYVRPIKRIKV